MEQVKKDINLLEIRIMSYGQVNTNRIVEILEKHDIVVYQFTYRYIYVFIGTEKSNDISIDTYSLRGFSDDEILDYVKKHIIKCIINKKDDTEEKIEEKSFTTNLRWEHLTQESTPSWANWMKYVRNFNGKIIFKLYFSNSDKKIKLLNCETDVTYVSIKNMDDAYKLVYKLSSNIKETKSFEREAFLTIDERKKNIRKKLNNGR